MKVSLCLAALFVVGLIISSCGNEMDSEDEIDSGDEVDLEHFIFKDHELPECCRLATLENPEDDWPCGAKSNPYVSSDRQFIDCFVPLMLVSARGWLFELVPDEEQLEVESLTAASRAALYSVYLSDDELGIFGIQFDSEKSAKRATAFLKDLGEDRDVYSKGRVVILMWTDGAHEPYSKLRKLVEARFSIK